MGIAGTRYPVTHSASALGVYTSDGVTTPVTPGVTRYPCWASISPALHAAHGPPRTLYAATAVPPAAAPRLEAAGRLAETVAYPLCGRIAKRHRGGDAGDGSWGVTVSGYRGRVSDRPRRSYRISLNLLCGARLSVPIRRQHQKGHDQNL